MQQTYERIKWLHKAALRISELFGCVHIRNIGVVKLLVTFHENKICYQSSINRLHLVKKKKCNSFKSLFKLKVPLSRLIS